MDLNKHIVSDGKNIFHSNGYANIQTGDQFGAVDPTSFTKRREIEQNRRVVGRYQHSVIGSQRNTYIRPTQPTTESARPDFSRPQQGASRFVEPTRRKYNPYG